eukprot:1862702-Ditylum_brightwellii.AAC.2
MPAGQVISMEAKWLNAQCLCQFWDSIKEEVLLVVVEFKEASFLPFSHDLTVESNAFLYTGM